MTDDHHVFPDREHAAERYLLGEMTDADREQYEAHVFSCAECAEDVRTTAAFLEDVRGYVASPAAQPLPRPDTVTRPENVIALNRPERPAGLRSLFWPLPAGAAVAATLMLGVIGYEAVSIAGLKRDLTAEQRLQSVPSFFLSAARSQIQTITVSGRQRKITLRFSQFDRPFPFYRCDIRDAAGRLVQTDVVEAQASSDELQVLVQSNELTPGAYTVDIAGLESAASTTSPLEPAHYQFTLQRQE